MTHPKEENMLRKELSRSGVDTKTAVVRFRLEIVQAPIAQGQANVSPRKSKALQAHTTGLRINHKRSLGNAVTHPTAVFEEKTQFLAGLSRQSMEIGIPSNSHQSAS